MKRFLFLPILLLVGSMAILPPATFAQEVPAPPTAGPDVAPKQLVHPGGYQTQADLERVRTMVKEGREPWKSAAAALLKMGPDAKTKSGVSETSTNVYQLQNEGHAAYVLAIKWVVTGDMEYAKASIGIIDAWTSKVKSAKFGGTMRNGLGGNQMANAAEILAHGFSGSAGWPQADVDRARTWFKEVLYPNVTTGKMRSANWGTSCLAGAMAMAIFCDDRTMFNDSVYAYEHGFTNTTDGGAGVTQYIISTGENAESGRDQPHSQGGIAHLMEVAVMAYNQGLPSVMAFADHRIVTVFEYTAKYNLGNEVPYQPFPDYSGIMIYKNGISAKGRGQFSPIYEMANYYFTKAGYDAPYTRQVTKSAGYQPEATSSDHTGLGTLLYQLETPVQDPVKKDL